MQKIMIIEDEPDIVELLEYNLRREGFSTSAANDGALGLRLACQFRPALIVLDVLLPGMDGFEICRQLRMIKETRMIPILMLTAKSEETDRVLGLGLGADDYVTKPFSARVVVARVRALLRRSNPVSEKSQRVEVGPICIDKSRHEARLDGSLLQLTLAEFRVLYELASQKGRVFTREQLLDPITGGDGVVIDRNVDVHIGSIRKKLGREGSRIQTVRGVGYKLRDSP